MYFQLEFQLTPNNYTSLRDLRDLTRQIKDVVVHEKTMSKNLEKFESRLDEMLKSAPKDGHKTDVYQEQVGLLITVVV